MQRARRANPLSNQRLARIALAAAVLLVAGCAGDPETAARQGAEAQQLLDAGDIRGAQETVASAIAERDDLPALHLLRGRIEIAAGNNAAAFQAYENALAFDPANLEALQSVAQLGLRVGNLDRSRQAAEQILSLQPDQLDALLITGVHQLIRSRTADALATAQRVLVLDPTNEGGTILKARSQFLQGETRSALETVRAREKALGPTEALALTELELLREAQDAPGMLASFAYLRTVRSKDVDLRIDEANVRYKLADATGARAVLARALKADRPSPGQIATIVGLWREYDRSPLSTSDLADLGNAAADTRLAIARHYLARSDPRTADGIVKGLGSSDASGVRARVAAASGHGAAAMLLADATLANDETQCDALIARASASLARGNLAAAVLDGQRAVAECPGWAAATLPLVAAYRERADGAGVQRSFAEAVSRIPQDSELSRGFSFWLESAGKPREAVAEARRLTRKAPALVSGWQNYLAVCSRHPEMDCASDAREGLAKALKTYAIDLAPGASPPRGLIGRLPAR